MSKATRPKKTRLQFDFTQKQVEEIDDYAERLDASSRAEVMRKALAVLGFMLDARATGKTVYVQDGSGESILCVL